ncbi:MAG: carbohydrate kinase [Lachnospiraceae bacterium]|nr:carbohydrate kinase [Lachnospiraceae bacterium]
MDKQYDVVALGELLMDMTNNGTSAQGNSLYEANPGGAPCNVLSMLQKLGKKTAFIGKVGDDLFGRELRSVIEEVGIDSCGLITDPQARTTLAFVRNFEDGDRDFSFYRNPGADILLQTEEIPKKMLQQTRIFHFGTLSMTHEPVRSATIHALELAKKSNALISFDPNIREPLWDDMEQARRAVYTGLYYCDILKISDNEIEWLTGVKNHTEGVRRIYEKYPIPLITVSRGRMDPGDGVIGPFWGTWMEL